MTVSLTEWWERATEVLANRRFDNELKQIHGHANLIEYLGMSATPQVQFTYRAEKLRDAADQIFLSINLEERSGRSLFEDDLKQALSTVANLLFSFCTVRPGHIHFGDSMLRSALCYELAGQSANAWVALHHLELSKVSHSIRYTLHPKTTCYLLISRRIGELRWLVRQWRASNNHDQQQKLFLASLIKLNRFLLSGHESDLTETIDSLITLEKVCLEAYAADFWPYIRALILILRRLQTYSTWLLVAKNTTNMSPLYTKYLRCLSIGIGRPHVSPIIKTEVRTKQVIDLWPSQRKVLEAGLLRESRDIVLRMPTSAGKTRVAELSILKALSASPQSLCVYVVPYLALANEIRQSLRQTLGFTGLRISDLFDGELGLTEIEALMIKRNNIVITTPEKLDLVIRRIPNFLSAVSLFVFDEGHLIDESSRGIHYEFLLNRLRRLRERHNYGYNILLMSAVIPNAEELAQWVCGTTRGLISDDWKPTRIRFGVFHWAGDSGIIRYVDAESAGEEYFVPKLIQRRRLRKNYYPSSKSEVCAELSIALKKGGPVAIFASTKKNLGGVVTALLDTLKKRNMTLFNRLSKSQKENLSQAKGVMEEYLGEDHQLLKALDKGFVYHNADLPTAVRQQVEKLFSESIVDVIVSTNTLAQGVNFPIKTLLVHSLMRGKNAHLPARDFQNMAGRVSRAGKHINGQVVFVHDDEVQSLNWAESEVYKNQSADAYVISGVLLLYSQLAHRNGQLAGDEKSRQMLNLLAKARNLDDKEDLSLQNRLEESIAALDAQLLALMLEDAVADENSLDAALQNSLFHIQTLEFKIKPEPIRNDLISRISNISVQVSGSEEQRRFYRTGLSVKSCQSILARISEILEEFTTLPTSLESARTLVDKLVDAAMAASETKPDTSLVTSEILTAFWEWISGTRIGRMQRPIQLKPEEFSKLIEDLFARKIPWGLNALFILAEAPLREKYGVMPAYLTFLSSFSRYGVSSVSAVMCRALGISDRASSIVLGNAFPLGADSTNFDELISWLCSLLPTDLTNILGNNEVARRVYEELQESQAGNPGLYSQDGFANVEVRGLQHHIKRQASALLRIEQDLELEREPNNLYDTNAIRVFTDNETHLGYIDRDIARMLAPLIDEGIKMSAVIEQITKRAKGFPVGRVFINVKPAV